MLKCLASERLAVIGNHIEKVKKEKLKLQQNIEAMSLTGKTGHVCDHRDTSQIVIFIAASAAALPSKHNSDCLQKQLVSLCLSAA